MLTCYHRFPQSQYIWNYFVANFLCSLTFTQLYYLFAPNKIQAKEVKRADIHQN